MELYATSQVNQALKKNGYCLLPGKNYFLNDSLKNDFAKLNEEWDFLPQDNYLKYVDNNFKETSPIYRHRRWGQYLFYPKYHALQPLPYSPFTQYKVATKIEREVAPWLPRIYQNSFLHELIKNDFFTFQDIMPTMECYTVNVHLIRVTDGNPSPEGAHQDDVFCFSVRLINLYNAYGGEAEIYNTQGEVVNKLTLNNLLDTYFVNDQLLLHKANSIYRIDNLMKSFRDVLIISFLNETYL